MRYYIIFIVSVCVLILGWVFFLNDSPLPNEPVKGSSVSVLEGEVTVERNGEENTLHSKERLEVDENGNTN